MVTKTEKLKSRTTEAELIWRLKKMNKAEMINNYQKAILWLHWLFLMVLRCDKFMKNTILIKICHKNQLVLLVC